MSSVLFEYMSNSAFPQTGEAWLSQDSIHWLPLINSLLPRPSFQVFNLGILFVVKPPFRVFNLISHFLFHFFMWFKLSFRVFTLNLFLFLFFSCQNCSFGFSILTSLSSDGLKHNTFWLYQHWWDRGTFSRPFRWVSMLILRKPFSQHRAPSS